ncbi:MAG: KOW domain-containing RNA-binding protein [Ruminococcus sp.]|nr:KOW domain-containing RNA-binding protein [Ruminococcus sp.]
MSIVKGSIVKAKAGRDKDSFFVVLRVNHEYAVIADGKRRTLEHPKNKKLKHLEPTNTVIEGSLRTNPQVKKILNNFKNGG